MGCQPATRDCKQTHGLLCHEVPGGSRPVAGIIWEHYMQICDTKTPVLVLNSTQQADLAIARSVGRAGIAVYHLGRQRFTPAFFSRYNKRHFLWDLNDSPEDESLAYLEKVRRAIGCRALLFATGDDVAIFLAKHVDVLRQWFVLPQQDEQLTRTLINKGSMYRLARKFDLPTPATWFPRCIDELLSDMKNTKFPVVLKPIDRDRAVRRSGKRIHRVSSIAELVERFSEAEDLMLQEYIGGPEDACWIFQGYFNSRSECLVSFVGRKLRQCPAYGGSTSLGVWEPNELVDHMLRNFFTKIGYCGIVDVCLRYDARSKLYKVLDVNPRMGANFRLFVAANGLDLARVCYLDMTGQQVPEIEPAPGRKYVVEDTDFLSSYHYHRAGDLTIREWLKSLKGVDEWGYSAIDDPIATIPRIIANSVEILRKTVRSARGATRRRVSRTALAARSQER